MIVKIIRIKVAMATILGIIMAAINLNPSWSQYAGTVTDYLFYPTIGLIYGIFLLCGFIHPEKNRHLYNIFKKWNVSFGTQSLITAYLFLLVQGFSVNSPIYFVELLHFIFTGLAIFSSTLMLIFFPKTQSKRKLSIKLAIGGTLGFLAAFLFHLYTIAWGEVIIAIPQSLMIWYTIKKQNNETI